MITLHAHPTAAPAIGQAELPVVRLRLIGQMEAWTLASESILPPGRKTRALLAMVALAAPRPVTRARLAELLWSRRPEEQARASLRQDIHRLQDVLAPAGQPILSITRDTLSLRPGLVWVDVDEMLRATVAHPASLALLDGELLETMDGIDPAFDTWLGAERERLRDRARSVAEALLRQTSAPEPMIAVAQQLLSIDRAHEGAWRALMRAHAARGERGMAIQSYDRCRATLADTLGAPPSPETQDLLQEIRVGRPAALNGTAAGPAVHTAPAPPGPPAAVHVAVSALDSGTPGNPALAPRPRAPAAAVPAARDSVRIGVLSLALVGTEEAEAHLALGLAEAVNLALARFRWMFLVSGAAIAQFVAAGRDDAALQQAFGLDYILDGSVQKAGRRLRVTMRLVDLREGQVVWARRFDRQATDLLSLQDNVAAEVAAQVDSEILLIEARRAARRPAEDSTAYDLLLRAVPGLMQLERQRFGRAGVLLHRAVMQEPHYAAGHAWYAMWLMLQIGQGWADNPAEILAGAALHAERSIALDPGDARGFAVAGHVRAYLQRRLPEAAALHERALALNPNLAMAWALSAYTELYRGDWQEALRRLERYKQLSPLDPIAFFYDAGFCAAALLRHDHAAAAAAGRAASELNPAFSAGCKPYLSALGHLGDLGEAAVVRRRLLTIEPGFNVRGFLAASPYERQEDRSHAAEGLVLAGIPETGDDPP